MSVIITSAVAAAATVGIVHSTSLTAGPAIWQGTMMLLLLPFMSLFYWAWRKEPIYPQCKAEHALRRKWVRIRNAVWIIYVMIGVALCAVLVILNI